jgi:protein strawberry notch
MYKRITSGGSVKGLKNPKQALRDIGLLVIRDGAEVIPKEDQYNVPRFLNRILALDVEPQNALFDYFAELFDQSVRYAKAAGTFDEGVTDINALAIRLAKPPLVVHLDKTTGAETVLYTLEVDRPADTVDFGRADRLRSNYKGQFVQQRKTRDYALVIPSGRHTDPISGDTFLTYSVWKPEGSRVSYVRQGELDAKYRVVRPDEVAQSWRQRYTAAPTVETSQTHIIAGAIIPLWHKLKTENEERLSVVRVCTKDGQRIVGVEIPPTNIARVFRSLGLGSSPKEPTEAFAAVLGGEDLKLACNLRLKRSTLLRNPAIELLCSDSSYFGRLRQLGLINEQMRGKQRFFVPTDEKTGVAILSKLLELYPVIDEAQVEDELRLIQATETTEIKTVDLEHWIVPPEPEVADASEMQIAGTIPAEILSIVTPATEMPPQIGPSLLSLLDQRDGMRRRIRKPRPISEGQGLLFASFSPASSL